MSTKIARKKIQMSNFIIQLLMFYEIRELYDRLRKKDVYVNTFLNKGEGVADSPSLRLEFPSGLHFY